METVYIDSTIPSYYFEERNEVIIKARKEITIAWWNGARLKYELYTSAFVHAELSKGDYPNKRDALNLIADIPLLAVTDSVQEIIQTYIANKLMPADLAGDAAHLATTSWHKIDYLLTWNLQHLANVNKLHHIRIINTRLALFVPQIVTPEYFFDEEAI